MNLRGHHFSQNANQKFQGFLRYQLPGQKFFKFLVGILGETVTTQFHFEFNWPLGSSKCQLLWGRKVDEEEYLVKKRQKLVTVVCEQPLSSTAISEWKNSCKNIRCYFSKIEKYSIPDEKWWNIKCDLIRN